MCSSYEIVEGREVVIRGRVGNIQDITTGRRYKAVGDLPYPLDASFTIFTDLSAVSGRGKAHITLFVGDADHGVCEVVENKEVDHA